MRRRFEWRLSVQTSFLHLGPQIDWGESRVPPPPPPPPLQNAVDRRLRCVTVTYHEFNQARRADRGRGTDGLRRRRSIIRGRDNGHFLIMENQYRRSGKDKWEGVNMPGNQHDHMPDHIFPFSRYLRFKSSKAMHFITEKETPAPVIVPRESLIHAFGGQRQIERRMEEEGAIRTIPFH